ncbi:QacE family quaternary ammonium compound efflux SMR transporter [Oceanobacillus piezotolerans]|uniref:QacE family quaternary ammonium compound efflux SMR transporter n=1 Tax=Oceanobacillus piezotolerans TaxID=2448030 RepID=A0A498DC53_9BACI|nr:multidrug efflux SMR transporter [Oceanobacillus piezotolerans]RLL46547.1 QacE family quaternary ammonium compound efflux SMR transporter [Oceanobacillus piezotolerans]
MNKDWSIVFLAGLFEIGWVTGLNHSYNWWTWALTLIAIYASMHLLIIGSERLPVGTTYAVFAGMGTAGTVVMEIFVFGEAFQLEKIVLILILLCGVIGLKLITPNEEQEGGDA